MRGGNATAPDELQFSCLMQLQDPTSHFILPPLHFLNLYPRNPESFWETHFSFRNSLNSVSQTASRPKFTFYSVDVSKEDKPTLDQSDSPPQEPDNFDKRRLEEKFAVLNTGIYECRPCGHKFDESVGDPSYPIPPGLPYEKVPEDWRCPTCGAAKSFFVSKSVEIAGFAQNQLYGLGGNALTSGQKALLIYGSFLIFLCFILVWLLLAIMHPGEKYDDSTGLHTWKKLYILYLKSNALLVNHMTIRNGVRDFAWQAYLWELVVFPGLLLAVIQQNRDRNGQILSK